MSGHASTSPRHQGEPSGRRVLLKRVETVIRKAVPTLVTMMVSTIADTVTQVLMARLGPNELTACSWINTCSIFQSSLSAPTNALYGLLGDKLGAIDPSCLALQDLREDDINTLYFLMEQKEKEFQAAELISGKNFEQDIDLASAVKVIQSWPRAQYKDCSLTTRQVKALQAFLVEKNLIDLSEALYLKELTELEKNAARLALFRLAQQGLYYSLLSIPVVAITFYYSGSILTQLFQEKTNIAAIAQRFLRWYLIGVPAFSYTASLRPYLCVLNHRNAVTIINILGILLMSVFSYGLSEGAFGLPRLGVEGLALAKAMRNWFNALASTFVVFKMKSGPGIRVGEKILDVGEINLIDLFKFSQSSIQDSWQSMKELLKTGMPLSVRIGVEWSSAFFGNAFFRWINEEALTVSSAINVISGLVLTVAQSFGNAGVELAGTMRGCKDYVAAYHYGNMAIGLTLLWGLISTALVPWIIRPFSELLLGASALSNPLVRTWLQPLGVLATVALVFDSLRYTAASAYQGLTKNTVGPMLCSLLGMVGVGLSLSYALGVKVLSSPYGVEAGFMLGDFTAGILCTTLWLRANYKSPHVPEESKPCQSLVACFRSCLKWGQYFRSVGPRGLRLTEPLLPSASRAISMPYMIDQPEKSEVIVLVKKTDLVGLPRPESLMFAREISSRSASNGQLSSTGGIGDQVPSPSPISIPPMMLGEGPASPEK